MCILSRKPRAYCKGPVGLQGRLMIARYFLFFVFASATLVPSLFADKTDKAREAAALQDRAKQLSDIRAQGAPAFQLKATFRITKEDGSVADGRYTELWV